MEPDNPNTNKTEPVSVKDDYEPEVYKVFVKEEVIIMDPLKCEWFDDCEEDMGVQETESSQCYSGHISAESHSPERTPNEGSCQKQSESEENSDIYTGRSPNETHTSAQAQKKVSSCTVCNKLFRQKHHLLDHMRIHTEKPFVCNVCAKSFKYKQLLETHMRIHMGKRPFLCDVCKKSFTQRQHLLNHERIHTGEKPFSCDVCRKSFSRKHHLSRHMRIHTDSRVPKYFNK